MNRTRLLLVTDPTYQARGRVYGAEDTWLAHRLREDFVVASCHPLDAVELMDDAALVLVRNTGASIRFLEQHRAFMAAARARGTRVYNTLDARGDMLGKQYLLDLTRAGYPVIPTVAHPADAHLLGPASGYVTKPMFGSDSIGMRQVAPADLPAVPVGTLIQPRIDFRYEVSFHFVGRVFHYALHAPDPDRRWELTRYEPSAADLAWAQSFVDWNTMSHGVQRIDGMRTSDGRLLLVELEDHNPYLSLEVLDAATREAFVAAMIEDLRGTFA